MLFSCASLAGIDSQQQEYAAMILQHATSRPFSVCSCFLARIMLSPFSCRFSKITRLLNVAG